LADGELRAGAAGRKPLFSVLVINWNGRHHLDECFDSVLGQSFKDFELFLVDNASEDGSAEHVRERYGERARCVVLPSNAGFSGAYNAAIPQSRGSYVILLNNDTRVDGDWLRALADAVARHPDAGMFTPKVLEYGDPGRIDNTGHVLYRDGISRGRHRLERDDGRFDREDEVIFPSGCAGVYKREMLERVGLLDESFFSFGEDTELGLKGRWAGYRCFFVPEARVYHKYSATWGKYSPGKAFLVERNRIWILWKHFPAWNILASPWHTFLRYLCHLRGLLQKKGATHRFAESYPAWKLALVVLRAHGSALRGLPRVLRQRREFASRRKITAAEFRGLLARFGATAGEVALKD
jgi:GT2 family glycosyltransferase